MKEDKNTDKLLDEALDSIKSMGLQELPQQAQRKIEQRIFEQNFEPVKKVFFHHAKVMAIFAAILVVMNIALLIRTQPWLEEVVFQVEKVSEEEEFGEYYHLQPLHDEEAGN